MRLHLTAALVAATTLAACATGPRGDYAAQHPPGDYAAPHPPGASMARYDRQMQAMSEMHEKMTAAKTPAERQALMAEHMKAMHEGMAMMCEMGGGMGGGMGGAPSGNAGEPMMKRCMAMKDMATKMMQDREATKP